MSNMLNSLESFLFEHGWILDITGPQTDPSDYGGDSWTAMTLKNLCESQLEYERSEDGQADENSVAFIKEFDEHASKGLTIDYQKICEHLAAFIYD